MSGGKISDKITDGKTSLQNIQHDTLCKITYELFYVNITSDFGRFETFHSAFEKNNVFL